MVSPRLWLPSSPTFYVPPGSASLVRVLMWKEVLMWKKGGERVAISAWNLHMSDGLQSSNTADRYPTGLEKKQALSHSLLNTQSTNHLWKTTRQLAHKLYYLLSRKALVQFYHTEVTHESVGAEGLGRHCLNTNNGYLSQMKGAHQ